MLAGFLIVLFLICAPTFCRADDAQVLPKGIFRALMDGNFYLPIHRRYNPDGKSEPLATDFNATLNSSIFPALAPLDPFVPGLPSIGNSIVSFEYEVQTVDFGFQYGLTDKITVGVKVPYWNFRNKVKAAVNSAVGSSANVGTNRFFACGSPICPLAVPGTTRMTTEDVQNLLGRGLDVNGDGIIDVRGFNYKRFQSWNSNGLSDVEAGLRYQYFKSEDWRLAAGTGVRFPTGRVDDADNLTDYAFGSGAYALLFNFHHDYFLSNLWKDKRPLPLAEGADSFEAGDLVLNGTFRYNVVLPDKQTKRVPSTTNNPITANKEVVKRDLGDVFEFETAAKYGLWEGLTLSGLYRYTFKNKDTVSGNKGFVYNSLEEETNAKSHIYIFGLQYSTVPLYRQQKFPIPMSASFSYRNRFAGSNNVLRNQYFGFALNLFF